MREKLIETLFKFAEEYDTNDYSVEDLANFLIESELVSEKQIPKKITHEANIRDLSTCPYCKNVVGKREKLGDSWINIQEPYCKLCGQKLDWED